MPESELPQQGSDRGGRIHTTEERLHPTAADHVQVVNAVRASTHAGDHGRQLRRRIGRPGSDPRYRDPNLVGQQLRQAGLGGQRMTGTSPAHDTRWSSSKTADAEVNLWDTCTGSAFLNWSD